MRAILTCGHGDRNQLELRTDHPEPKPGPAEVTVKVVATAINYHDVFTRRGMPGIKISFPVIVGSDLAGQVSEVGSEVRDWKPGDRVLIDPVFRDGERFGMIGETADGGRAEFAAVAANQLVRVPDGVSLEAAAALPLAYGTAYRMIVTRGQVKAGERVLVLGASGGVGVACVQLAKLIGAEVIACASSDDKIARLQALGADHGVNYHRTRFVEAVREIYGKPRITGTGGVNVVVNFTGGDTWLDSQKSVALGGRILCCGATAGFNLTTDARYLWTFEQTIVGSDGWAKADLATLLDLLAQGKLAPVIDRVLALEQAAEGERLLEDREVFGKVLLRI